MDGHRAGTRLLLLGAPQALRESTPLPFERKKSLALLAYLTVNKGPHLRERIAALLWPDSDESHARGSLRAVLSDLRRTLGRGAFQETGELVGPIDDSTFWLDVDELSAAVDAVKAGSCEDPLECLDNAASLYCGSFMSGFTLTGCNQYTDWQIFCEGHYRKLLSWALERLTSLCRESEAYDQGIDFARRWTALDSFHEPAHRSLMALYALSGQTGAALRQYDQCASILQDELGFEPEPETSELANAIRAHAVAPRNTRVERRASQRGPAIAVLPLEWMGEAGPDAWFADGIADALSGRLSKLDGVSVAPYSSSSRYRGSTKTDYWIATELAVDYLLTGNVLRSDQEIAVSTRLIRVASGEQVWSERYRRHGEKLLDFQEEVAHEVARQIHPQMNPDSLTRSTDPMDVRPKAFELFLKAKFIFRVALHVDSMLQAIELFREALEIDPDFAEAYGELSLVYAYLGGGFPGCLGFPPDVANQLAKEAAESALRIDPEQNTAKCTLAGVLFDVEWQFKRGEMMLREILEHDPDHLHTLVSLGQLLLSFGRFDEAMELFRRARSLDPIDTTTAASVYLVLRNRGLYRQALSELDRMEELHPNTFRPHLCRAEVSFLTGNYRKSVEQFETAFAFPHGEPVAIHFAPFYIGALARGGDRDAALEQLERVRSHAEAGRTPLNHLAMAYCGLSDMEDCREWLNRSFEKREQSFLTLRFEIYWDTLVSDPVCAEIIQRAGLPI